MSGAHTWGNHQNRACPESSDWPRELFQRSWVPVLSGSTAALPCTPSKGTEPSEKIGLFLQITVLRLRVSPPQQILGQGSGSASRPMSSWDTGHFTKPVLKWGPQEHTRVGWGASSAPWAPGLRPLTSGTSPLPLLPTTGPLSVTCLRGRREGRLTEEGGPGGAHDSLALSRPHTPSSPPVGGTLQTPTLGGQHSPSAGLPRLTPHSELRVGITRFQPQFLEATFPLDLAGVQAPPAGLSSHPGDLGQFAHTPAFPSSF